MVNENHGAETFAGKSFSECLTSQYKSEYICHPTPRVELLVSFFLLGIYEVSLNLLKKKNNKYSASKSLFIACQCPPLPPYSVDRTDLQKEG